MPAELTRFALEISREIAPQRPAGDRQSGLVTHQLRPPTTANPLSPNPSREPRGLETILTDLPNYPESRPITRVIAITPPSPVLTRSNWFFGFEEEISLNLGG